MPTHTLKAKLLLAMAMADGVFDPKELELLADRAVFWGISADDFEHILDNPEITDEESNALPEALDERAALLSELILMAFADGELSLEELDVLIKLGGLLGVSEDTVRFTCVKEARSFGVDIPDDM
ncbi:MAG: hypothetical protein O7G85_07865 [Planctomycetota bacterium]|nr:hypothetical protein [Planctomycetota bacterium]